VHRTTCLGGLQAARRSSRWVQGLNWGSSWCVKSSELVRPSRVRLCRPVGHGEDRRGTFGVLGAGACLQTLFPARRGPLSVILQAGGRRRRRRWAAAGGQLAAAGGRRHVPAGEGPAPQRRGLAAALIVRSPQPLPHFTVQIACASLCVAANQLEGTG
jgi:hypothetical protein